MTAQPDLSSRFYVPTPVYQSESILRCNKSAPTILSGMWNYAEFLSAH